MKKIIFLLTFSSMFSLNLFGDCIHIGYQSGLTCSGDEIIIDDLQTNFTSTMKVSDSELTVLDIPIYIYSTLRGRVQLQLNENQPLSNGEETISTTFYLVQNNQEDEITLGEAFSVGGRGRRQSQLDGQTLIAQIRIKVNNLSDIQTAGKYRLKKYIQAKLRRTYTSSSTITATGEVEQVTIVGFEDVSTYTSQQLFKDAFIDYGLINFNTINRQVRDIYVKNNTTGACQISFNTSPLISQIDSNYKIPMKYFYQKDGEAEEEILNAEPFTLIVGKNNGSKVGMMSFETEEITGPLIAGDYKATLQVTVSAN
jgi:hypothetical protein